MIIVSKANENHVQGIKRVCSEGYRATYHQLLSENYINGVIKEFYNEKRILQEVTQSDTHWGGYFVALDHKEVVGAIGGGMVSESAGEVFVLYLDPSRRKEGIGTFLLNALTRQQKEEFSATEQWVSVAKDNHLGIPFYEARGFRFQYEKPGFAQIEGERYSSLRYFRYI